MTNISEGILTQSQDTVDLEQSMESAKNDADADQSQLHEDADEDFISWSACTSMDWAFVPKSDLPVKEEYDPVEKFVYDAMRARSTNPFTDAEQQKTAVLGYKAILDLFKQQDDLTMLTKIFLAFRTSGGGRTLGMMIADSKRHAALFHLIFKMDPFTSEEKSASSSDKILADAYLNFVITIVSANSIFLTPAMNMLWRCLQSTDAVTDTDKQLIIHKDDSKSKEEIEKIVKEQFERNSRLHGTLVKILELVPKANSEIYPLLASSFPFKLKPLEIQANYMKQCFIVLNYVPTARQSVLELCLDKCLEIDVEIRIAQDGKVDIDDTKEDDALFTMDEETDTGKETPLVIENRTVDEMAEKLDTLMYLTFQNLAASAKLISTQDLYKMIIPAFDSVILTTHRSKFVQFVTFFLCGLDNDANGNQGASNENDDENTQNILSREFAAKLIDLVLDPLNPSINRQSAACYLASFVSRSKAVCISTACEAVSAILRFAEAYMDTYHTEALARNARRGATAGFGSGLQSNSSKVSTHSLFYTVCQAAFYIMCFRGKQCIQYYKKAIDYHSSLDNHAENDDDESHILLYPEPSFIDISSKRWTRLASHHLNPLKYCLESVRGEFLLLSDRFELIDAEILNKLIIEDRKMASGNKTGSQVKKPTAIRTAATLEKKRMTGGVGGLGRGSNPLDSFFPFDPYLLRRSYFFVEPYYRHWIGSLADDPSFQESDEESITNSAPDESLEIEGESDFEDSDDDEEDSFDHDHEQSLVEATEVTAMSLTSTTCSFFQEDESDNEITAEDMAVPADTWVKELKRARALSIEDCW